MFRANERFRKGAEVRGSLNRYVLLLLLLFSWVGATSTCNGWLHVLCAAPPSRAVVRRRANRMKVHVPTKQESMVKMMYPVAVMGLWVVNYYLFMR